MRHVRKGRVIASTGQTYEGFIQEHGRMVGSPPQVSVFESARIELHPHGRQDYGVAKFLKVALPREVDGDIRYCDCIATLTNPAVIEWGEEVPVSKLHIVAIQEGTWFEHYGLHKIKGIKRLQS